MHDVIGIELIFYREIESIGIASKIRETHSLPANWDADAITDWVEYQYGDLIDNGWTFAFKFAEGQRRV